MKVKELIERLNELCGDAEVYFSDYFGKFEISAAEEIRVVQPEGGVRSVVVLLEESIDD